MVELVDDCCDSVCATSAEPRNPVSVRSSAMLEAVTRLPGAGGGGGGGFAATALRDLTSFECSVQPNRSLPLRPPPPTPRRISSAPAGRLNRQPSLLSADESDEKTNPAAAPTKPDEDAEPQLRLLPVEPPEAAEGQLEQVEQTVETTDATEATRNGVTDHQHITGENSEQQQQQARMVPPLKLKKLASSGSQSEGLESPVETTVEVATTSATTSVTTLTTTVTMGALDSVAANCAPNSIEIMIPSMPELGIKETRTDRISFTPDSSAHKPLIVNYIVGKESSSSTPAAGSPCLPSPQLPVSVHVPVLAAPLPRRSPEVLRRCSNESPSSQQPRRCDSRASAGSNPHSSLPVASAESGDEVQLIEDPSERARVAEKSLLRESHREQRAAAIEARHRMCANACMLPEDSPQRARLQDMIDACDRDIGRLTGLLRKISEAPGPAASSLAAGSPSAQVDEASPESGSNRHERDTSSATQTGDSPSTDMSPKLQASPSEFQHQQHLHSAEPVVDARKRELQRINGYPETRTELYPERRAHSAADTDQSSVVQGRSVIVEPCPRTSSEPGPAGARRVYSSFLIDELNAAPSPAAAAALLRPGLQQTGPPASSPREAVVACVPDQLWAQHHQQQLQQRAQQLQLTDASTPPIDDCRRPLDLAIKSTKRPSPSPQQRLSPADDKRKRPRRDPPDAVNLAATETPNPWLTMYTAQASFKAQSVPLATSSPVSRAQYPQQQQQQQHQYSFPATDARLWATPAASIVDYRSITHGKPSEYAIAMQRIHENALSTEQAKARESSIIKSASRQQQQQQRQISPKSDAVKLTEEQLLSDPRLIAAQFPTLGNWVADLGRSPKPGDAGSLKKDSLHDRGGSALDSRQPYYQPTNGAMYKQIAPAMTSSYARNSGSSSNSNSGATSNSSVRWNSASQQQQQQQQQAGLRSFQQVTPSLPRQQPYYSPASIALSYQAKFPQAAAALAGSSQPSLELYQKSAASMLQAYNCAAPGQPAAATYPWYNHHHPRLSSSAAGLESTQQQQQQRLPPLIPLQSPAQAAVNGASGSASALEQLAAVDAASRRNLARFYGQETAASLQRQRASFAAYPAGAGRLGAVPDLCTPSDAAQYSRMLQATALGYDKHATAMHPTQSREYDAVASLYGIRGVPALANGGLSPEVAKSSARLDTSHVRTSPSSSSSQQRSRSSASASALSSAPVGSNSSSSRPLSTEGLRCSNCNAPGSRFECLGCESAVYCNEACQTQHWSIHVAQCPKIMPRLKKVA